MWRNARGPPPETTPMGREWRPRLGMELEVIEVSLVLWMYGRGCMDVCMYVCVCVCVCICVCMCVYVCMCMYVPTYARLKLDM